MNMTVKMIVAGVGMAAALGASAMTEAIAYYGNIRNADGTPFDRPQQMAMTFRIYDSMNSQVVLWARTIPVRVETDGSFYAELSDKNGAPLASGAPAKDQTLARVCANAQGAIQIGLTPPDSAEFSPRQLLSAYPAADYAVYAKGAPKATFKIPLSTDTVVVGGDATLAGDLTVGFSDSELLHKPIAIRPVPGGMTTVKGKEIVFVNGVKGWVTKTNNPAAWCEKGPDRVITRRRFFANYTDNYKVWHPSSEIKGFNESASSENVIAVQGF